ncbi:hypothetical protein BC833DRAFT_114517 [Globomyces pollinis-pini]|nr:hypothetical protein BC833DRAFT_114517 [Globomyces pollinis-pini]
MNPCSSCTARNIACTYTKSSRKRGPSKMTVSTDSISTTNSCKSPESIRASSYGTLTSARPSVSSPTRTKMFNTLPITNESVSEVDTDNAKTAKILLDLNSSPEFSSTRVLAGSRSTVGNSMLTIQDGKISRVLYA